MGSKLIPSILFIFIFFIEGAIFVLIPYSSSLITNVFFANYSLVQYGLLFLSLAFGGVLSSLWAGKYAERRGLHKAFVIGILCHVFTVFFIGTILISLTYAFLNFIFFICAIFFLGAGMGIIHTVVNSLIAFHFPKRVEVAITAFYIAVGVGAFFGSFLFHYGNFALFLILFLLSIFSLFFLFDLYMEYPPPLTEEKRKEPIKGLWSLLIAIFCWGIYEQLVYDWTVIYLINVKSIPASLAEWSHRFIVIFFTLSRVFLAFILLKVSMRHIFWILPLLLTLFTAFVHFYISEKNTFVLFAGIGFLYSSILPLTIAFAIKNYRERMTLATSRVIAAFILGLGLRSFIYGQLNRLGWFPLSNLFLLATLCAVAVFIFNVMSLKRYPPLPPEETNA